MNERQERQDIRATLIVALALIVAIIWMVLSVRDARGQEEILEEEVEISQEAVLIAPEVQAPDRQLPGDGGDLQGQQRPRFRDIGR